LREKGSGSYRCRPELTPYSLSHIHYPLPPSHCVQHRTSARSSVVVVLALETSPPSLVSNQRSGPDFRVLELVLASPKIKKLHLQTLRYISPTQLLAAHLGSRQKGTACPIGPAPSRGAVTSPN
jgi:hypothetical protein